jgi:hypothetical protein
MIDDWNDAFDELIARGFLEADGRLDGEGNTPYRLTPLAIAALDQSNLDRLLRNLTAGDN